MPTTAFPLISFPEKTSAGRHPLVLSQGEVRPGVKQGQHWGVPPLPASDVNTETQ